MALVHHLHLVVFGLCIWALPLHEVLQLLQLVHARIPTAGAHRVAPTVPRLRVLRRQALEAFDHVNDRVLLIRPVVRDVLELATRAELAAAVQCEADTASLAPLHRDHAPFEHRRRRGVRGLLRPARRGHRHGTLEEAFGRVAEPRAGASRGAPRSQRTPRRAARRASRSKSPPGRAARGAPRAVLPPRTRRRGPAWRPRPSARSAPAAATGHRERRAFPGGRGRGRTGSEGRGIQLQRTNGIAQRVPTVHRKALALRTPCNTVSSQTGYKEYGSGMAGDRVGPSPGRPGTGGRGGGIIGDPGEDREHMIIVGAIVIGMRGKRIDPGYRIT